MKDIIDVSEHNGTLDWDLIKPQIDGAILRCGYGGDVTTQDDKQYLRNVQECTRLQIPCGVYLFSYARNASEAQDEAAHVLRLVQGFDFDLPIYYDLEYSSYVGDLSAATYAQIATAFCTKIEAAGGFVGIYANTSFWKNKLANVNDYSRWVAQWASSVTLDKPYQLWQYTSDGVIHGSNARTDLNKWFDNFLTMAGSQNHFSKATPPIPPTPPISPTTTYKVGDVVSFNALFTSSTSSQPITNIAITTGTITKVIAGTHNPYLINNGTGWVNDSVILTTTPTPPSTLYSVGDYVHFNALFISSVSTEKITNIAVSEGEITMVIQGARNPYLMNNGTGWINDSVIVDASNSVNFQIGDRVRVRQGAKDYKGAGLASFVYDTTYQVMEVNGDRVVIGNGSQVTAAMHATDLYHV